MVIIRKGLDKTHHTCTHEELIDEKSGYQIENHYFVERSMQAWAYFVKTMSSFKEGDGTLLDRTLVLAHSDQEWAKIHAITGIPMFTAGTAGGKLKTGLHVAGAGDPGSRVGYTVMRALGMNVSGFGSGSMATAREIGEILV